MAASPAHKFGQIIGNLLEEIMLPLLRNFSKERGLYLDSQGPRSPARKGKKVTWEDKYGNVHDLDFVIERHGSKSEIGRPAAFIEAAWRRYTKHSRNKAQEIQGAVLPVAETHPWDQPFLGTVLAGVFTDGSLNQMRSVGFNVLLFPYESIVEAFSSVGIDVEFDEETPVDVFEETIEAIEGLSSQDRESLKDHLVAANQNSIDQFLDSLHRALDRVVDQILVIPLIGSDHVFDSVEGALEYVNAYDEASSDGLFRKYEIIVRYSNGDKIDATFSNKDETRQFLQYIGT